MKVKEEAYYDSVKKKIEQLLKEKISNVHLEKTPKGNFSPSLKKEIPKSREIIFSFLKGRGKVSPDITGFVKKQYGSNFVVVEIKKEDIKIDDIYQTMKYRDLFDSKYTFLVCLKPIPEEIKRLCDLAHILYHPDTSRFFVLASFNEKTNNFIEWYPEDPFKKEYYWR